MFSFKKYFSSGVFFAFLLLLGLSAAHAEPKIVFENESHDFGEIEQMTSNKHIFRFTNKGDEDLIIKEVKTSCGCTAALLSSTTIKPDETGEIEVNFNSGRFKNVVKKTVYVETNMKDKPVKNLFISATVKYDQTKEEALRKAREEYMRKSKEKGEAPPRPPVTPSAAGKSAATPPQSTHAPALPPKAAGQPGDSSKKHEILQKPQISVVPAGADSELLKKISFHPREISLGKIELNKDYKRTVKMINLTSDKQFFIERVETSVPYVATMINKPGILPNDPGMLELIVNVKQTGDLTRGFIYIRIRGERYPIEIPVSWKTF